MRFIFNRILSFIGKVVSFTLNLKIIYKWYNQLYERANYSFVKYCVQYIKLPNQDFIWKIILLNKQVVKTYIKKNNKKTIEFALSYKWHSPALNFTEKILNDFYTNDTPWIDVGANLGLRSLLSLSTGRPVFFIEPNWELNFLNNERCKMNTYQNYTFFKCGASDKQGEVDFYIDKSSYKSSIEANVVSHNELESKKVIIINTIDNLFMNNLDKWKNACIKIDVEGHELRVLEGAQNFIKALKPTLIIEVNSKGNHFRTFYEKMQSFDYKIYEILKFKHQKYYKRITFETNYNRLISNDYLCIYDNRLEEYIEKYTIPFT